MPPGITAASAAVASNDAFLASYVARVVTISSTRTERCCRSSRLPTFEQDCCGIRSILLKSRWPVGPALSGGSECR